MTENGTKVYVVSTVVHYESSGGVVGVFSTDEAAHQMRIALMADGRKWWDAVTIEALTLDDPDTDVETIE